MASDIRIRAGHFRDEVSLPGHTFMDGDTTLRKSILSEDFQKNRFRKP